MKKRWIPLLVFAACASGGSITTMDSFHEIPIGASSQQVVASIGKPSTVNKKDDGTIEYEYVERIKIGARDAQERRYIIVMKDGVVVSKRVKMSSPLPYGFDSYEMQTTQNADSEAPAPESNK